MVGSDPTILSSLSAVGLYFTCTRKRKKHERDDDEEMDTEMVSDHKKPAVRLRVGL